MPNLNDFTLILRGLKTTLQQSVELLTPGIEKGVGYHDYLLHLDHIFGDLDSEREHTYLDLWKSQTSGDWYEIRPVTKEVPAENVDGRPVNAEHDSCELIIGGTSKWAAPAPLAGRLCKMYPDLHCECLGTTEHTDCERWVGTNGMLCLVDEWVDDFRKGVITYRRRDGIVLDPPVVEHAEPGDATDIEREVLTEEQIEALDRGRDGVKEITEEEFHRRLNQT